MTYLFGIIRTVLAALLGKYIADGIISEELFQAVVSVVGLSAVAAWSVIEKKYLKK